MMEELISKKKLLANLKGLEEVLATQDAPSVANIVHRTIGCVENQPVVLMGLDLSMEGVVHESSVSGI